MGDYETWVGVAFLIWFFSVVRFFIAINSQLERNLNKIGVRHSWLTLTPKPLEPADAPRSLGAKIFAFVWIFGWGFAAILLGPITVACFVGGWLYQMSKGRGMPADFKEFRWKMRNLDLSAEQINALNASLEAGFK